MLAAPQSRQLACWLHSHDGRLTSRLIQLASGAKSLLLGLVLDCRWPNAGTEAFLNRPTDHVKCGFICKDKVDTRFKEDVPIATGSQ